MAGTKGAEVPPEGGGKNRAGGEYARSCGADSIIWPSVRGCDVVPAVGYGRLKAEGAVVAGVCRQEWGDCGIEVADGKTAADEQLCGRTGE